MGARVLIVDDEPDMVENLIRALRRTGYRCLRATDGERGLALLESEHPDLLITDLRMPVVDGMQLVRAARALDPPVPAIVVTAFAAVDSAVAAMREGAFDYLPKDFSIDHLLVMVDRALRQRALQVENRNLRRQLETTFRLDSFVGHSQAMIRVMEVVQKATRTDANILVLGESGTGKELTARAIHANGARSRKPFVPVDCASLPENLLESELFGHEKGAFTGAIRSKPGLMETAHGGTLFLDEIAELPPALQPKLLRALQERKIRRVGGTGLIDVDVRVVSATSRDLRELMAKGQFREELYYRVNVIEIRLPPLRDRDGDVKPLAHAFLKKYGGDRVVRFEDDALAAIESYSWPGNVRELQNVIERACALADTYAVRRDDLPDYVAGPGFRGRSPAMGIGNGVKLPLGEDDMPLRNAKARWMSVLERTYLTTILDRHHTVSAAARVAGIDRKTFHRLLAKHGVRNGERRLAAS